MITLVLCNISGSIIWLWFKILKGNFPWWNYILEYWHLICIITYNSLSLINIFNINHIYLKILDRSWQFCNFLIIINSVKNSKKNNSYIVLLEIMIYSIGLLTIANLLIFLILIFWHYLLGDYIMTHFFLKLLIL